MKIRKIALINNPILGDLNLDFTDENGKSVDTIILAGENGTGKTSILDLLFTFSNISLENVARNEKRSFEVEISLDEQQILKQNINQGRIFSQGFKDGLLTFVFDFNIISNWNQIKVEFLNEDSQTIIGTGHNFQDPDIKKAFQAIYSDVEINYTPNQIDTVTSKDIDENKTKSYKSGNNLATEITQLLIDIETLDSLQFSQWGKQNIGNPVIESQIGTRIKRFTKAFDLIFPTKKFLGIQNKNNHKVVLFEEKGKTMSISQLSSGEKQIVFRGGFLLKDKESSKGSMILIDEPEISLHPNWQIEILDFYKALFFDNNLHLSSQIFVATHSPFIIHNPKRNNDKVIILAKNENGTIRTLDDPTFYSWTKSKIIKEAFRIDYDLTNKKGKLFLEGETDEKYFKKAKEIFGLDLAYDISWIGRINENGNTEFTGYSALNQAKSLFIANSDLIQSKIILYYDSDTNKPEETFGNLLVRKMQLNKTNTIYEIGVENLLNLSEGFDKSGFYSEIIKKDKYGVESIIRNLDKTKLCDWICDDCSLDEQKEILKNIEPILIGFNEQYN